MTAPLAVPLAEIFPEMEGEEFKALVADIKAHGLREPITMFEGLILDGRNRHRACIAAKVEPRFEEFKGDRAAALAFVVSKNIHRRHLTPKQKRDALVKIVAAQPGKSDRALGKEIGVHHSAIGRARKAGEATGAVAPVKKRTGTDGKTRRRPKKTTKPSAKVDGKAATGAGGTDSWNQWQAEARQHVTTDPVTTGATAATAAKPPEALVWKRGNRSGSHYASVGDGSYQIRPKQRDGYMVEFCPNRRSKNHRDRTIGARIASLDEAKAAAQADYATAATAAKPEALMWKTPRSRSRGMKNEDSIEAKTSGGKYKVYKTIGGHYSVNYSPKPLQPGGVAFVRQLALDLASQEDAKAVAQADYEKSTAKPIGKREAKRLAKERHQEAMGPRARLSPRQSLPVTAN